MELVEIRDLDGPNLFLRTPAIKLEWAASGDSTGVAEPFVSAFVVDGELRDELAAVIVSVPAHRVDTLLTETVNRLHDLAGVSRPETVTRPLEEPGHRAIAYSWFHRSLGRQIAKGAWQLLTGNLDGLAARLA
ncbi:MAG TPA: hypothetical protein VD767_01840, partial [Thermomicrobiales bacterium]|nr:hypothetical protein [Thermomicrobiales bacterium]